MVFGIGRSACAVQFLRLKDVTWTEKSLSVFALEIPVPIIFVKSMWNRNPSKRSASADVQPKINVTEIGPEKSSGTKCTAPTVGNAVKLLTPADS